jgi:hypothetical protein
MISILVCIEICNRAGSDLHWTIMYCQVKKIEIKYIKGCIYMGVMCTQWSNYQRDTNVYMGETLFVDGWVL